MLFFPYRTHVMILEMEDRQCIKGWVYSFQSFTWTLQNKCIDKRDQPLGPSGPFEIRLELEVSAYFDKNAALQILVMYNYGEQYQSINKLEIVLIDGKSFDSSRIELSTVCNHYQKDFVCNTFTLVSIQSHIYFIHSYYSEEDIDTLDIYAWNGNGLQLECAQKIKRKPLSNLDGCWETKDFYAISTLF